MTFMSSSRNPVMNWSSDRCISFFRLIPDVGRGFFNTRLESGELAQYF
jgi:hypothetical protein